MDTVIGTLFPPKIRAAIYVLTVMGAAAYAVAQEHVALHWGWKAGYAAWNALAGLVAAANLTRKAAELAPGVLLQVDPVTGPTS